MDIRKLKQDNFHGFWMAIGDTSIAIKLNNFFGSLWLVSQIVFILLLIKFYGRLFFTISSRHQVFLFFLTVNIINFKMTTFFFFVTIGMANSKIEEMLDSGIIHPKRISTILAAKKSKKRWTEVEVRGGSSKGKLSFDSRIPLLNDILEQIIESAIFISVLDLAIGYHQLLMQESDREKTAFGTGRSSISSISDCQWDWWTVAGRFRYWCIECWARIFLCTWIISWCMEVIVVD